MRRKDEEHEHQIFRGQIAYATIIQTDKCALLGLGVGLSISKYQIFRGQIAYAMIIQMDKCALWASSGTEQLIIPNISRLDDLCYDNEKHSWWMRAWHCQDEDETA